jgi:hypothetical protein
MKINIDLTKENGYDNMKMKRKYYLFLILCSFRACSERLPTQADFIDWISARYTEEVGLSATKVMICRWERTRKEITRLAPEVDGLLVEAALFSTIKSDSLQTDHEESLVHYVFCRYYLVTDEWYLQASSWGGGFWKQDPNEWGHLVEECQQRAEQIKQQRDRKRQGE